MSTVEVPLTRGKVALVDEEDAAAVLAHKWYTRRVRDAFYAARSLPRVDGVQREQRLHTFLTGWPLVDHRNGDGLDNRRANLRAATNAENMRNRRRYANNTSGFKGVSFHKATGKWRAQINLSDRRSHLGSHATAADAARAYDAAAREHFGEFAYLNFPTERPTT